RGHGADLAAAADACFGRIRDAMSLAVEQRGERGGRLARIAKAAEKRGDALPVAGREPRPYLGQRGEDGAPDGAVVPECPQVPGELAGVLPPEEGGQVPGHELREGGRSPFSDTGPITPLRDASSQCRQDHVCSD